MERDTTADRLAVLLGSGTISYVKAPLRLVERSTLPGFALCVNRRGTFKLLREDYSVVSHVCGETLSWQMPSGWGPVELPLRKKGLYLEHL